MEEINGIKISQFPSLQSFTGKENFVVQEGFYNYKVNIETLRDHISKNEVFFCDFINEKTENVTDEQYDVLLAAINTRNIIMIGSNAYLRIINDVRVSEDILSLRASQSLDSGSALILTSIEYDISVESENGVHAVTVKSSSQSFDHSGDGTKFLNDAGEYSPIPSGVGGVQFVDIRNNYQSHGGVYEWLLDNITFEEVESAINANKLIVIRYAGATYSRFGCRFIATKISELLNSDQTIKGYNLFTIAQDESNAVADDYGDYTFKNDGIPVYAKVVTILATGYVWFDGVQYSGDLHLPVDLNFKTKGDGTKFLSDNGTYVDGLPGGGTEGQVLKIVNGKPTWVDPS